PETHQHADKHARDGCNSKPGSNAQHTDPEISPQLPGRNQIACRCLQRGWRRKEERIDCVRSRQDLPGNEHHHWPQESQNEAQPTPALCATHDATAVGSAADSSRSNDQIRRNSVENAGSERTVSIDRGRAKGTSMSALI